MSHFMYLERHCCSKVEQKKVYLRNKCAAHKKYALRKECAKCNLGAEKEKSSIFIINFL